MVNVLYIYFTTTKYLVEENSVWVTIGKIRLWNGWIQDDTKKLLLILLVE